jgi:GAF domain-containing protein/ABC-type uncharacterized transport system substrate-binding protein
MRLVEKVGMIGLLWALLLTVVSGSVSYAQDSHTRRVLVLNSYHPGYKWTDDIMAGIEAGLAEWSGDIDLHVEYMDTKRILDEQYLQRLRDLYLYKFWNAEFDVIISSDDDAFNFLRQYRDQLFPDTPVVFCGVNYFTPEALEGRELFTGVNEEVDLRSGLDVALRLHPNTKRIVVVNDTSTTGRKIHDRLMQIIPLYEQQVEFVLLEDVTMAEVQQRVRALPADSLVFYTIFFRDAAGQVFEYDESIALIADLSPVPVYGAWDFSLGNGIVGGMLASGYYQGEMAAQLAVRVLRGEPAGDIPAVMQSPSRYMFDYERMQLFNLSVPDLPQGSEVINQPVTFYSQNKKLIGGIAVGLVGLGVVVVILVSTVLKRRGVEEELRNSNRELRAIQETLEQRVVERTQELEKRFGQMQAAADVSQATTSALNPDEVLDRVVNLTRERFHLYYVGLFLLDEDRRFAVLRAGTGQPGRQMLARGHKLEVGGDSMIGQCVVSGEPRVMLDTDQEVVHFDNPFLPHTRSELALPLRSRGQIIGGMSVQSIRPSAFDAADIAVLQTMADQVAIAIDNAHLFADAERLFAETQAALQEAEATHRRYLRQAWGQYTGARQITGYQYSTEPGQAETHMAPLSGELLPEVEQAISVGRPVMRSKSGPPDKPGQNAPSSVLVAPIILRGQPIGALGFAQTKEDRQWSADDVALAESIAEQFALAAERLRLFEDTQRRAEYERLTSEITGRMRETLDVDIILRTAVREIGEALRLHDMTIRLEMDGNEAENK